MRHRRDRVLWQPMTYQKSPNTVQNGSFQCVATYLPILVSIQALCWRSRSCWGCIGWILPRAVFAVCLSMWKERLGSSGTDTRSCSCGQLHHEIDKDIAPSPIIHHTRTRSPSFFAPSILSIDETYFRSGVTSHSFSLHLSFLLNSG